MIRLIKMERLDVVTVNKKENYEFIKLATNLIRHLI